MAATGETNYKGTAVEVAKNGTTTWDKFVCNENAIEIDFGTDATSSRVCLETGEEIVGAGSTSYGEQELDYVWTQELTNAADTTIRNAKIATAIADKKVNLRITMNNKTGVETKGTLYLVPFIVTGYKHLGVKDGVWTTKAKIKQIGVPVETPAA
ncbi:MAG: hypothetical protein PHE73_03600 [Sulfurovaceae bacterium]|nr:hypothetical protein [Sulfurovaceae bacterium]